MFKEDIEYTPAKYFPVPDQTTPAWHEKVRALERIKPQSLEYMKVFTVRYLHALDSIYEDQQQELSGWIVKVMETRNELHNVTMELHRANREKAILQLQLDSCHQELREAQQQPYSRKHARWIKQGRRTFARRPIATGTRSGVPAYDPQHPHYDLNGYVPKESMSDHETIETEESMADNFTNKETTQDARDAGPSK